MIYLASDHRGYRLKEEIKKLLKLQGQEYEDMGPHEFDPLDDYPDYIIPAAKKVSENPNKNKAIIIGASGQGEAIAANKVKGVRAVVFYGGSKEIIYLSRTHNNSNVLSLGAKFIDPSSIQEIITIWLSLPFPCAERHNRRIKKIEKFEAGR